MQSRSHITRRRWQAGIVILGTAILAIVPFFFYGIPSGHDFGFHQYSWLEVQHQWHQGILLPRWASLAHYGYGEARFLFYPPISWILGAGLGTLFPWPWVPGIFTWIAVSASGLGMYWCAREFLPRRNAMAAAMLYMFNPYQLLVIYWRSASAELLTAALFPVMLRLVWRLRKPGLRNALWLALLLAAGWLTNAPAAVMLYYSLAMLVTIVALQQRDWRIFGRTAFAAAAGGALAAFYLVPAAHEQSWVNLAEVFSAGVRPQDNFLFTQLADVLHNRFNWLVSVVAVAEISALACILFFRSAFSKRVPKLHDVVVLPALWAFMAAALMVSVADPLWHTLPKMQFVQLPWRWLLPFNTALVLVLALTLREWWKQAVLWLMLLGVLLYCGQWLQPPWWDHADDIREMQRAVAESGHAGPGYEGTDEYAPIGADPYEIKQDAPRARVLAPETGLITIERWAPEVKAMKVSTLHPAEIELRLFNYPAWQVKLNEKIVETKASETTAQIILPVPAGESEIEVRFVRTWDRTAGAWISLVAFLAWLCGLLMLRRPSTSAAR